MHCEVCGIELQDDWTDGNVMVNSDNYYNNRRVSTIYIVCKICTRSIPVANMHNLWELSWLMYNGVNTFERAKSVGINFGFLAAEKINGILKQSSLKSAPELRLMQGEKYGQASKNNRRNRGRNDL